MNKVLFTYFGPYSDFEINPSEILAMKLKRRTENKSIEFIKLDVSFSSVENLIAKIQKNNYDYVILTGVSRNSRKIKLETQAKNFIEGSDIFHIKKNGAIILKSPSHLNTNFPKEKYNSIISSFPNQITDSTNAGKYLCNYTYFRLLDLFKTEKIIFVHIPDFISKTDATNKNTCLNLMNLFLTEIK